MARIVVITNPNDDRITSYFGAWSKKMADVALTQPDTVVFDLSNKNATQSNLTKLIEKESPQLIVLNGHGDHDLISGFNEEVLIKADHNEHLTKNSIVHALACDTGKTLGPKCIKIGAIAYVGYKELFKLVSLNKTTVGEKQADGMASFFLDPAYEVVIALIEGNTVQQAYERSQKMYLENLKILYNRSSNMYNTTLAGQLFHNYQNQICFGNMAANF